MDMLQGETLAAPKKAKVSHETDGGVKSSGKKALIPFSPPDPVQEGDALLQDRHAIDVDETYGIHEQALNEFLKLHPMLSLYSSAHSNPQPPRGRSQPWVHPCGAGRAPATARCSSLEICWTSRLFRH